jgi:hypothetical protein
MTMEMAGMDPFQFESAIRLEASARKEPCILDLDARNARDFEQGRPELVFRDLNVGVLPEVRRAIGSCAAPAFSHAQE